jgi:hypothetical protein
MKAIEKTEIKVKVDISPGKVTERQKRLWESWWRLRIASVREEMENEEKSKDA